MKNALYKKPWPGLVAFVIAILSQWLGHSTYAVIEGVFGTARFIAAGGLGAIGAVIIWRGLKKPEVPATWMGFLGGSLMWVGWFEFSFAYFAELYAVVPYEVDSMYSAVPSANMLQATLPPAFALFLLYGLFNRNTKCNLIRWFHRNLRFDPGMPAPDPQRSFARITALETLFVIWACYLFWLYVFYFGSESSIVLIAYVGWCAWFAYIFWKLMKIPRLGHAVRYGIPVGIVGWGVVEMPSHFGFYPEIWLKPFENPVACLVALAIFIGGLVYVARKNSIIGVEPQLSL